MRLLEGQPGKERGKIEGQSYGFASSLAL